jgi:hypothetical protein
LPNRAVASSLAPAIFARNTIRLCSPRTKVHDCATAHGLSSVSRSAGVVGWSVAAAICVDRAAAVMATTVDTTASRAILARTRCSPW